MPKSINELILIYFKKHPKKDLEHGPVVDWVTKQWLKDHKTPPRDPWRAIRLLHQKGILIKVRKGVYKYDPDFINEKELWKFPEEIKAAIMQRDGYKCQACGRGKEDGAELCVDHRTPKDKGGTNNIENGMTLCSRCNLLKKNFSQTEFGKKIFRNIYKQAIEANDEKMIAFCKCVFNCYDAHKINGHIPRPNGE